LKVLIGALKKDKRDLLEMKNEIKRQVRDMGDLIQRLQQIVDRLEDELDGGDR